MNEARQIALALAACMTFAACSRAQSAPDAAPKASSSASEAESLRKMIADLPPVPELPEEPSPTPPLPESVKVAIEAVRSDELVSESFRLLDEGVSPTTVVAVLSKHLKSASPEAVGCSLSRLRDADAATIDPAQARAHAAIESLSRALAAEASARGVDAGCPALKGDTPLRRNTP